MLLCTTRVLCTRILICGASSLFRSPATQDRTLCGTITVPLWIARNRGMGKRGHISVGLVPSHKRPTLDLFLEPEMTRNVGWFVQGGQVIVVAAYQDGADGLKR